jgi:cytochrome c peroxidase
VLRGALCIGIAAALAACESEPPDPFLPLLKKHTGMGDPQPDSSNKYVLDPAAAALGKKFYFDTNFSGSEVYADMLLQPMTTPGRAAMGAPIKVACNTCHDVTRGGADHTSNPPGNIVSFGGGAYDVNGEETLNAAYHQLIYWNGRNDSLWSQIVAVTESHVSVNGSRLRVAWRIADAYRADYEAVFGEYPLPAELDSVAAQAARLESDGTCTLAAGQCPSYCQTQNGPCLPRFPLEGRPGYVRPGQLPVCTWGTTSDPILQPYQDAYDCMQLADQLAVTRIYVNYAKAIAAYEYTLISKDSQFDAWADAGFPTGMLDASAERGAHLFVGKAACAECHMGPLFTDDDFHMIGVPQEGMYVPRTTECSAGGYCDCTTDDRFQPQNCIPIGARDGLRKLQANKFRRDSVWSDDLTCANHYAEHVDVNYTSAHADECDGRVKWYSLPLTDDLRGAWKTPSLRDITLTAPYMHNGMYDTLDQVMVHYNQGGMIDTTGAEVNGTIDPKIKQLNLTDQEMADLVAFLQTLTGQVDPDVIAAPTVPPDSPFPTN